ncbi:hypothetical protein MMC22_005507 [Lobaria immixta]|nr:hypothetical protein [Lobaria immixta]
MATNTFSALPPEVHGIIAEHFETCDLISLCRSSKAMHERCLHVLYRHVDLRYDPWSVSLPKPLKRIRTFDFQIKKLGQLVGTLLSHARYGTYVRSVKGTIFMQKFDDQYLLTQNGTSEAELLRAMESLTHVRNIDISYTTVLDDGMLPSARQFPDRLFQSATSVKLQGPMLYDLAKSILSAVNPALLRHLCLDLVKDERLGREIKPGDLGEDGRTIAPGVMSGLLTPLTGRCTALQTLKLRRKVQADNGDHEWHGAADQASYLEWASFIRSVQETVEKFTFEQIEGGLLWVNRRFPASWSVRKRFRQLLLPAIVSGTWPCLKIMELRGLGLPRGRFGTHALKTDLRAALGEKVQIVVEVEARYMLDKREPDRWN